MMTLNLASRSPIPRWLSATLGILMLAWPGTAAASSAPAQPSAVVTASAHAQRVRTTPGDQFSVAIVLDFADGWHAWPNKPVLPKGMEDLLAIPTEISLAKTPPPPAGVGVHLAHVQWPRAHEIESAAFTGEPVKILSYSERTVIYVPVTIGRDAAPGKVVLPFSVSYQACDDSMCLQPTSVGATVTFEVGPAGAPVENAADEAIFAAFQPAVFATILGGVGGPPSSGPTPPAAPDAETAPSTSLFGYELPDPTGGGLGLVILLIVAILGGAVMNLTPCVLPVIPIKIMTLTQHAGSQHGALRLGLWMALGIVAFWTAIGIPMAFISSALDPSRYIFGVWWVSFGIGLVIIMMGLGIMGMFNLTLPQSLYKVNPKADTAWGSFVFGIMTAILGLPCFGFVAGGLLAAASFWPPLTTMSVFSGMGIGMAAPFLILSANPKLVSKMPRTGPASELVKQVMGLMLLAAAAFFIAVGLSTLISSKPYMLSTMKWWATALFLALAGLWLILRTFQITKAPVRRAVITVLSLLLVVGSVAFAWSETGIKRENYLKLEAAGEHNGSFVTGAWNHYTPAVFEKARASGKIVVADFTAEWCLICKSLKRAVLDRDPVYSELMKSDVILFEVDLSDNGAPGWAFLRSLGRTGIPTLAIFTPGVEEPQVFNAYTSTTVMDAMQRARDQMNATTAAATTP